MYDIQKIANLQAEEAGRAYEVFAFTTVTGEPIQIRVERAQSRDLKYVYRALLRANADLPAKETKALRLVQNAIDAESPLYLRYASDLGWQSDTKGFVFWDKHVHPPGENSVVPPEWIANQVDGQLTTTGKLKHWKKYVGRHAVRSSRLILLAAAAFAAPLVRFTDKPNPGLNLFGLSGPDIDIAAALVGSILGQGAGDAVSEWWTEPPRFAQACAAV